jgi:hypothetical protein
MTAPSPSAGPELLAFLNTLETYNETQAMAGIDDGYLATIARVRGYSLMTSRIDDDN